MKALVQALWLLTTAIGDSIIVLITALNLFSNMATEFFAYAGAIKKPQFAPDDEDDVIAPGVKLRAFSIDPHDGQYVFTADERLEDPPFIVERF
ncbi:hypothetical protein OESDEN_02333 [Oesophagostomum dentatum]|uniref:Uncharacterized protein n=1 Tax=Oesophagostomum dentatum TaxID=61180 RepID=A0A0B1TKD6_OESDE|nr:hypothetical protein OESDEN_02333 [Oesophagostomum dentatum]